jgi:hypothetical protein
MFDITFTAEQLEELEVLVRSRLEFIEEAREEYGYLTYADEFVALRVMANKIEEAVAVTA